MTHGASSPLQSSAPLSFVVSECITSIPKTLQDTDLFKLTPVQHTQCHHLLLLPFWSVLITFSFYVIVGQLSLVLFWEFLPIKSINGHIWYMSNHIQLSDSFNQLDLFLITRNIIDIIQVNLILGIVSLMDGWIQFFKKSISGEDLNNSSLKLQALSQEKTITSGELLKSRNNEKLPCLTRCLMFIFSSLKKIKLSSKKIQI